MKRLLLNNYKVKIVSVLLATGLWWFIYTGHHPTISSPVAVKIRYDNLSPQFRLVAPQKTVRVELSGESQLIADIGPDNLKAVVDLKGARKGRFMLPVNVVNLTGAQVIRNPAPVTVRIEQLNKIQLPVKLNFYGLLPVGFAPGRMTFHPRKVSVYGDEDGLSRAVEVVAAIDLTDRTKEFQTEARLRAEDAGGRVIPNLNISPEKISADILIQSKHTRIVRITPRFKPGSSFRGLKDANFYPATVTLIGDAGVLKSIWSVESDEFDLSLCREGGMFPLQLKLPKNVSANTTQVTITCEPRKRDTRSFLVTLRADNLCAGCDASIEPGEIEVTTEGPADAVDAIGISDISAAVDAKELQTGKYSLKPTVKLGGANSDVTVQFPSDEVKVTIAK
jgi:YbbR domain-containing protein